MADNFCPACTVWGQVLEVSRIHRVGPEEERAREIPLFPTAGGKTPTKRDVVKAWGDLMTEAAADWEPTKEGGHASLTYSGVDGHSPRRSGEKMLIRIGVPRGDRRLHREMGV